MGGLSRAQLKTIAVIAMVCDHLAWGFLDFYTLEAQVMHVIGRLTIPIMCFFIAEGYRKTSDLKKYIGRMTIFWIITIVPFYIFFHEEYVYRQNIILDLLLGLLAITVLERRFERWKKGMLMAGLVLISVTIGGWPVMPMLYILIFYYKKEFKEKCKWFCGATLMLQIFLMIAIALNQKYHFSSYDWIWYDKLYLLGFMLALPLLKFYNGEKGGWTKTRYVFYIFYPAHFLVLALLKLCVGTEFSYYLYLGMQIITILLSLYIFVRVMRFRPSGAQSALMLLSVSVLVYMFGFWVETTSEVLEAVCVAIQTEYLGECVMIIAATWFVGEFFDRHIPRWLYAIEGIVSSVTMFGVMTINKNTFFYHQMYMEYSGVAPRVIIEYGPGFFIFSGYMALFCIMIIYHGKKVVSNGHGVEKKRALYLSAGVLCPWIAIFLRWTGITGGYEISFVGILGIIASMAMVLFKYGYSNSVQLASENAFNHTNEGVLIVSINHRIHFFNKVIKELFPQIEKRKNADDIKELEELLQGKQTTLHVNGKVYDIRIDELTEMGYVHGYMLWTIDMTQHYNYLRELESSARTDALTGLLDRKYFNVCVEEAIRLKGTGCMIMFDLDNFKKVNDTCGHRTGDEILCAMADILRQMSDEISGKTYICRIGGDEFIMFCEGVVDKKKIASCCEMVLSRYKQQAEKLIEKVSTSVSIGICMLQQYDKSTIEELHQNADKALYLAKNKGKDTYQFYAE